MRVLAGVAIGAGLVAVSVGVAWWIAEQRRPQQAFVLTYTKPGGTMPVSAALLAGGPTPFNVPATRYASFIASRCKLLRWEIGTNANSSDVSEQAILRMPADGLSNQQFNCLAGFIKSGYVTLTRTTY